MLKEMIVHFWRAREYFTIYRYRRLYEMGYNEKQRVEHLPSNATRVVHEWMIERPLKYISRFRDAKLISILITMQSKGIPIIVYSDYPSFEKLQALNFAPSQSYCSIDLECMKPDATGIINELRSQSIAPERCLVIGDRFDKDGLLAKNMNSEYIILSQEASERQKTYERLETIGERGAQKKE